MSRNKIKFRHSFVSAQVFGLPSSTGPLGFPNKVCDMYVNPNYAQVRCPNGREMTVSLRNLAPCPQEDTADEEPDLPLTSVNNEEASNLENDLPSEQDEVTPQSDADDESRASPNFVPRRSSKNK